MIKLFTLYSSIILLVSVSIYPYEVKNPVERKNVITSVCEKVDDYENILKIIADKRSSREECYEAIKAASFYFQRDATIEVSSLKDTRPRTYHFLDYFTNLKGLKYSKVIIDFDPHKVHKVIKKAENHYEVEVDMNQKFYGKDKDGNIIYKDYTVKRIEIVFTKKKNDLGRVVKKIEFKCIKVIETRP